MMKNYLLFICLLVLGCTTPETPVFRKMQAWDKTMHRSPEAVRDSLQTLRPEELTRGEQAYYALLDAESASKAAVSFKSDSALRIAESYFKGREAYYLLARTQLYIGRLQYRKQQIEAAFNTLKEAEIHLGESGVEDPRTLALIYYWLGEVHDGQNNPDEALVYSEKAANLFAALKDTLQVVAVLNGVSFLHLKKQQPSEAQSVLDSCRRFLALIDPNTYRLGHIRFGVVSSYALLFEEQNQLDSALHYNSVCISLAPENSVPLAGLYLQRASILYRLGRYDESRSHSLKQLEEAEKEKNLLWAANACRTLFLVAEKQGKFEESCRYRERYNQLKDELNHAWEQEALKESERKYNIAAKEKELLEWKNQLLWLLAIMLSTVLCLSTSSLVTLSKKRKLQKKHNLLEEKILQTQWGYALSRRVIAYNFNAFEEMEKLIARHTREISEQFLLEFKKFSKQQKEAYFKELYSVIRNVERPFIDALQRLLPGLPEEEAVLAFLLREEWDLGDIANILDISFEAAKKRRYRLKAKLMGETQKETDLLDFLTSISN